jgi:hypothetical protein
MWRASKDQISEMEERLDKAITWSGKEPKLDVTPMEEICGHVLGAIHKGIASSRSFVDIVRYKDGVGVGWSLKTFQEGTALQWNRKSKIGEDREELVDNSKSSDTKKSMEACQKIGNRIMKISNGLPAVDFKKYELDIMVLAEVMVNDKGKTHYSEYLLPCTRDKSDLFDENGFDWRYNPNPDKGTAPGLWGFHKKTGERWWRYNCRGGFHLFFDGVESFIASHCKENDQVQKIYQPDLNKCFDM